MNIWFAIPVHSSVIDQAVETFARWRERGYRCAARVDTPADFCRLREEGVDLIKYAGQWEGYASAVNDLCRSLDRPHIIVTGGHDHSPDPNHTADEIGHQFRERFPDLCGVMQPTGDGFPGNGHAATSPWIGRGFIERFYGGKGPFWPGYFHFNCDCELREVAMAAGCYQERPDLSHHHAHWTRTTGTRPDHLMRAADAAAKDKALCDERRAAGWPGAIPSNRKATP